MSFSSIGLDLLKNPVVFEDSSSLTCRGYHVFWTIPFFEHTPDQSFYLNQFELEFAKLSALMWKMHNGPISLITDSKGAEYFRHVGMEDVYDQILPILPDHSYGLDSKKYWAAGKLLALKEISAPCVILDMDAIIWKKLSFTKVQAMAAHTEELNPDIYPDFDFFDMSRRYPKQNWDFSVLPLNTSFLYLENEKVKKDYVMQSLLFMQMERNTPNIGARCMVFAEQRILAMCLHQNGIQPHLLIDRSDHQQTLFTHLWSYKHVLFNDPEKAQDMIELCTQRIKEIEEKRL